MRLRNLLLLLLAVVLAIGTALLARSYLAAQRVQQAAQVAPPAPKPERSVLVAHSDIARGQILQPGDFTWQVWPENAIGSSYIIEGDGATPQSLSGWVAVDPIAAGAPVTRAMVISPGSGGFLAAVLKPGMRAIQLQNVALPNGTVPGDQVDMLVSFGLPDPTDPAESGLPLREKGWNGNRGIETVLRGLRILKIVGFQIEAGKPAEQRAPGNAPVIFEVTPKQAEIITLAEQIGQLTFTLDSLRHGNGETAARRGNTVLVATGDPSDAAPAGDRAAVPPMNTVGLDTPDTGPPTYMTDAEVDGMLRTPSVDIKTPVTIFHGLKKEDVVVVLRCTETACAQFGLVPTKLVGTQDLAGER